MNLITRREFLRTSAAAGMAAVLPYYKVLGANELINVAIVGLRGKGRHHIELFREIPGVRVATLCDADTEFIDERAKDFTDRGETVNTEVDFRRILDDKNIDAVVLATPNHWHALMTIWACQAGKDVYVEKPVCHSIWEGRKMVEAARKYKRIVQAGTQSRSCEGMPRVLDYISQGKLGKIKVVRGFCYKKRPNIGKVYGPQPVPSTVDYNLWTGPAPLKPLMRQGLHYDWHWVWDTGNGDIGNQGIHEMDLCRWALGQDGLAPRVASVGGRFGYDDDGQTANTQIAIFDYKPAPLIFEVKGLPEGRQYRDDSKSWGGNMPRYKGIRIGIVIECEDGYFAGDGSGGWIYDNDGKKIEKIVEDGRKQHQANFIDAMRSRNVGDLKADILEGYLSSSLCHMANISHRLGESAGPAAIRKAIKDISAADDSYERFQDHLLANEVNLEQTPVILGPWLDFDKDTEQFTNQPVAEWANTMLKDSYREPFVVPDVV